MRFYKKGISRKIGMPPGTLIHTGETKGIISIQVMIYDEHSCEEKKIARVEELTEIAAADKNVWININGIHDATLIEKIGQIFDLHPLLLEDLMSTGQRPKTEQYQNCLFMVLNMLWMESIEKQIESEQVSMVLKDNCLLTFQEKEGDLFEPIRDRIRQSKGKIRKEKCDYLCYALLDIIVDNYFLILENTGEQIENIEQEMISDPDTNTLKQLHNLKRNMIFLRKTIWPIREMVRNLERVESILVRSDTMLYFRDVYDHTIQIIDIVESSRDILSGMLDIYLSSVSNRMNEVMKVLTIIATIFIPLTFIAGVYGMNFEFMPELEFRWAYPIVLLVMLAIGGTMILYFKKKKWF